MVRAFIGPFILTFFICLLIFVLQFLWKYIDDFVGKGLEYDVLAELIFYMSASVVPEVVPLAVLLASIMTFGSLGENYELVALKSAGISLFRFMRPLLVVVMGLSVLTFCFSNYVLPVANLKFGTLLYSVVKAKPALNIKAGEFYSGIEGYIIKVDEKGEDNRTLEGVVIYDHRASDVNTNVLVAERGEMYSTMDGNSLIFVLYNGSQQEEMKGEGGKRSLHQYQRTEFDEYEMVIDLASFDFQKKDEGLFKKNHKMMSVGQLTGTIDSLGIKYTNYDKRAYDQLRPYYSFVRDTLAFGVPECPVEPGELVASMHLNKKHQQRILRAAGDKAKAVKNISQWSINQKKYALKKARKFHITLFDKFAMSFACLILFLIGAPLGAIIRKGGLGMPMVWAIFFFMIFYVLKTMGRKFAEEAVLSPFNGVWLAVFILSPIAIFLVYKAANDSALFDAESYLRPFKKIMRRLNKSEMKKA